MDLSAVGLIVVLTLPVFFFWRWIYRKINATFKRRILIWLTTIITAPILYAGVILLWMFSMEYYPNRDFNQKAWMADTDKRYEYSRDLIKSKLLIGKTRPQVEQLLGKNDDTSKTELYYYIGFRPELGGIDPSNIEVYFKNEKVDSVIEHDR